MTEDRSAPPSLTAELAALIGDKPISVSDRSAAAFFLLDAVASIVGGSQTAPGRLLTEWAGRSPGDPGRRALLMGGLCHILEIDDLHRRSVTHPGCVVVPAALALAKLAKAEGHALLDAILWGYEAMARIGNAVGPAHYRIWHNTATCGPFGSAMAAVKLLGLDHAAMVDALGNAGTQASGLWQFLETGAMSKHLHAGRAAESGLIAAELARVGFTGPPRILEGERGFFAATCPDGDPAEVLATADGPWELIQTSIKPWPSCRHTHPAIDAALALHRALATRAFRSARVEIYEAALDRCDRPRPTTPYEAKFSLQHCVAAALTDGRIDFDSFEAPARARLAPIAGLVTLAVAEPYASAYPKAWGAKLAVETVDGRWLEESRTHCKGDPELPIDQSALIAKAEGLMRLGGLDSSASASLIAECLATRENGPVPDPLRWIGGR